MKQLVIGLGEVGSAIQNILGCDGYDVNGGPPQEAQYDVLHICFPYSEGFTGSVKAYMLEWKPTLVIVHSSVPVGTCDKEGWVHSPIRGVHPNLEQGIKTFVKYFGGEKAVEAAAIFNELGINCYIDEKAATTEALKLWDTTQYGVMIMLEKHINKWCKENGLDPEIIYAHANRTYNLGYTRLGMEHVVRPYLKHMPGPIGGHCVVPNAHLLDEYFAKKVIVHNNTFKE
jgi:UDP-N-acetyl-D-mannosaminuronate dehydrogenase